MKNPYTLLLEEQGQRIRAICEGAVPTIDDAILARAMGTLMPDARLVDPAQKIIEDFHESLHPKIKDVWGLD